ncbi:hypothetical protein [Alkaliphilus sp. B6464]|uniref:hypothetical protein n=1 Tax=Alkaliphilus sp. B6464 TaxID=2731219 RepID=UPI001BA8C200|nr:hypothetical protein [Alkaliphilus sp. B6464]QUH21097.1 hypothetical protein HYG84_15220 [Alkaliphilus sp. B6464]
MDIKELRQELELAGIKIDNIPDEELSRLVEGWEVTFLGFVETFKGITEKIIKVLTPIAQNRIKERNKIEKYSKYLKRNHNRQLLYEKRKRLGKKL